MRHLLRIFLATMIFLIVFVRIVYCCVVHAREVFGERPVKENHDELCDLS